MFEEVKEIIVHLLCVKPEEVTLDARFVDDLGADSLDAVELVMYMEEKFGIEISDEVSDRWKTVGDAVNYINEHKRKG